MIAVWSAVLGTEIEITRPDQPAVRAVVIAVAMESIATAARDDGTKVGEFRFLVAIVDDGTVLDVPATACQLAPEVSYGKKQKGGNS